MATNDRLLDLAIRSAVYFDQLANDEVARAVALLDREVRPELQKALDRHLSALSRSPSPTKTQRYRDLIVRFGKIIDAGGVRLGSELRDRLDRVARVVSEQTAAHLAATVPLEITFGTPSPALLREVVRSSPFDGEVLSKWVDGLTSSAKRSLGRQVTRGLVNGESIPAITRRILGDPRARNAFTGAGSMKELRRNVRTVVRTATNHVANRARDAVFRENSNVIKAVRWVSTLDSRTTDICMSLDGQEFPVDQGQRPPAHHQCRSTIVPVTKSWRELGIKANDRRLGGRAFRDVRTNLSGLSPKDINYGQWLRQQPRAVQVEVLGERRTRLFRGNQVSFDRFFSDGRRLSLEELAAREGLTL